MPAGQRSGFQPTSCLARNAGGAQSDRFWVRLETTQDQHHGLAEVLSQSCWVQNVCWRIGSICFWNLAYCGNILVYKWFPEFRHAARACRSLPNIFRNFQHQPLAVPPQGHPKARRGGQVRARPRGAGDVFERRLRQRQHCGGLGEAGDPTGDVYGASERRGLDEVPKKYAKDQGLYPEIGGF